MPSVSKWRVAAAAGVLAVLAALGSQLLPIYLDNMKLQQFVEETARQPDSSELSDLALQAAVLKKAATLGLPVRRSNVQVERSAGGLRIDVRYVVRVDLPFYTVDLHFYPGAGSR
ncbi:MAG: DUF4845 domain-containing protein [Bryobacterales bacterium]|nr:DUF4845 domain-containing protein [Bryobacterales bacterium]